MSREPFKVFDGPGSCGLYSLCSATPSRTEPPVLLGCVTVCACEWERCVGMGPGFVFVIVIQNVMSLKEGF